MLAVALPMEMYLPFRIAIAKLKSLLSICSVTKLLGNQHRNHRCCTRSPLNTDAAIVKFSLALAEVTVAFADYVACVSWSCSACL